MDFDLAGGAAKKTPRSGRKSVKAKSATKDRAKARTEYQSFVSAKIAEYRRAGNTTDALARAAAEWRALKGTKKSAGKKPAAKKHAKKHAAKKRVAKK